MIQRLLFISAISFVITIILFGLILVIAGSGDWEVLLFRTAKVEITSVQPDCLKITKVAPQEGTTFKVDNSCGYPLKIIDSNKMPGDQLGFSEEEILGHELSTREYGLINSRSFFEKFFYNWDVRGKVGNEDLLIRGKTRAGPIYIIESILVVLMNVSLATMLIFGFIFVLQKLGRFKFHLILLLISFILVLSSVFIPMTIKSKTDLDDVRLGLPIRFVIQDQNIYDFPDYPLKTSFSSPWENPTHILWRNFLLSWLIVFVPLDLLFHLGWWAVEKHFDGQS